MCELTFLHKLNNFATSSITLFKPSEITFSEGEWLGGVISLIQTESQFPLSLIYIDFIQRPYSQR